LLTTLPVFFPNSDVSPLRRLRIQRAQEYGALWARIWGDNVTHIIVDKGLTFQDVLRHLCLKTFPVSLEHGFSLLLPD
jgi:DNA polymerase IV